MKTKEWWEIQKNKELFEEEKDFRADSFLKGVKEMTKVFKAAKGKLTGSEDAKNKFHQGVEEYKRKFQEPRKLQDGTIVQDRTREEVSYGGEYTGWKKKHWWETSPDFIGVKKQDNAYEKAFKKAIKKIREKKAKEKQEHQRKFEQGVKQYEKKFREPRRLADGTLLAQPRDEGARIYTGWRKNWWETSPELTGFKGPNHNNQKAFQKAVKEIEEKIQTKIEKYNKELKKGAAEYREKMQGPRRLIDGTPISADPRNESNFFMGWERKDWWNISSHMFKEGDPKVGEFQRKVKKMREGIKKGVEHVEKTIQTGVKDLKERKQRQELWKQKLAMPKNKLSKHMEKNLFGKYKNLFDPYNYTRKTAEKERADLELLRGVTRW